MPTPVRNEDGEYLTVSMAMKRLNMCRLKTINLASEANALFRYGKSQRINWDKLNEYFSKKCIEH